MVLRTKRITNPLTVIRYVILTEFLLNNDSPLVLGSSAPLLTVTPKKIAVWGSWCYYQVQP